MPEKWSVQVLPAGTYKVELWGPLRSGALVQVHYASIVLGHIIETAEVPVMVPRDGASHGRIVGTKQRVFSLLVAVPQEP